MKRGTPTAWAILAKEMLQRCVTRLTIAEMANSSSVSLAYLKRKVSGFPSSGFPHRFIISRISGVSTALISRIWLDVCDVLERTKQISPSTMFPYRKKSIFATKTPGSAPVRAAGSSAFSARPFYTKMSTCTKPCPEVWQAFLLNFETIYLKIALSVVLSL